MPGKCQHNWTVSILALLWCLSEVKGSRRSFLLVLSLSESTGLRGKKGQLHIAHPSIFPMLYSIFLHFQNGGKFQHSLFSFRMKTAPVALLGTSNRSLCPYSPRKIFILQLHHSPISTLCQLLLGGKGHVRPTTTVTAAGSDAPPSTCKRPCSWGSGGLAGPQGWVELTAGSADAALVSDMLCVCACVLSPCSTSPWHGPLQWIWIWICCACGNLQHGWMYLPHQIHH